MVLTLALVGLGGLGALALARDHAGARSAGAAHPGSSASASSSPSPSGGAAGRERAVQALLDRRAAAVRAHDERAFLADVDPSDASFVARQRAIYRGLVQVPFASFSYQVVPGRTFTVDAVTRRWGPSATVMAVVARHRLRGYDTGDVAEPVGLTVAVRDGRWVLVADDTVDASLPRGGHAAPWDVGEVAVATGRRCLVIGDARDRDTLATVAQRVDRAVAAVSRLWPTGGSTWPGRVVVYTARDKDVMSTYLETTADPRARPAAIALPVTDSFTWFDSLTRAPRAVGSRVIVDGSAEHAVDDVLLRHEITHVATQRQQGPGTPVWMVEGIADYTALRPTSVSDAIRLERGVDRPSATALDDGRYQLRLPASVLFYSDADTVDTNYVSALLACAYVRERWGEATLLRLHAQLSRSSDPLNEPDVTAAAFRAVLGVSVEQFERDAARAVQAAWDG